MRRVDPHTLRRVFVSIHGRRFLILGGSIIPQALGSSTDCFDEDFDAWSNIDDDNIGSPPPNSQPYRNLGLPPITLQCIYLPPQDPSLLIIALHHSSTPWELGLTPRSRMWIDEFGQNLGQIGFYYVYPCWYDASWGKGRMWRRTKGRFKGKVKGKGQIEPQGTRAPQPGIPTSSTVVARHALFIAALMGDLLPSLLLVLRRNLPLLPKRLRKNLLLSLRTNQTVMILILGLLFHTSKLAFRLKKGAPKPLRFILGMQELFQEPTDLFRILLVTPKHYMK